MKFSNHLSSLIILICICYSNLDAQPFEEVFEGFADIRAESDRLGYSVAISGDYAIAGAPQNGFGVTAAGYAMIFERDQDGNWGAVQRIVSDDAAVGDEFGFSVSISGDYALVGAPAADGAGSVNADIGAVYLFKRNNSSGSWEQVQKIIGGDGFDYSGTSVHISGNDVIIGHPGKRNGLPYNVGAATIYKINGVGSMDEVTTIVPTNSSQNAFGSAVSISGDYAVVGALRFITDQANNNNHGAVYLFKRDGNGNWDTGEQFIAESPIWDGAYGQRVAVGGNTALVSDSRQNKVDIFTHNGTSWARVQSLTPSQPNLSGMGQSLSISGDYALIGILDQTDGDGQKAEVYKRENASWNFFQFIDPNTPDFDYFGGAVSISDNRMMVGAMQEKFDANAANETFDAGKVYIYEVPQEDMVGLNSLDSRVKLNAYPNPAAGTLHFNVESADNTILMLTLRDLTGRQVAEHFCTTGAGELDLSRLSSGTYLLEVTEQGEVVQRLKILKAIN